MADDPSNPNKNTGITFSIQPVPPTSIPVPTLDSDGQTVEMTDHDISNAAALKDALLAIIPVASTANNDFMTRMLEEAEARTQKLEKTKNELEKTAQELENKTKILSAKTKSLNEQLIQLEQKLLEKQDKPEKKTKKLLEKKEIKNKKLKTINKKLEKLNSESQEIKNNLAFNATELEKSQINESVKESIKQQAADPHISLKEILEKMNNPVFNDTKEQAFLIALPYALQTQATAYQAIQDYNTVSLLREKNTSSSITKGDWDDLEYKKKIVADAMKKKNTVALVLESLLKHLKNESLENLLKKGNENLTPQVKDRIMIEQTQRLAIADMSKTFDAPTPKIPTPPLTPPPENRSPKITPPTEQPPLSFSEKCAQLGITPHPTHTGTKPGTELPPVQPPPGNVKKKPLGNVKTITLPPGHDKNALPPVRGTKIEPHQKPRGP